MKSKRKKSREGIKNIEKIKKSYDKGLKIFSPGGKLIYIGKPGFSIDYGQLLRQEKQKYRRYEGN